jgi:hypothetical protein
MSTENKIIDRVRKLMALAADGSGATEAEASTAAAMAAAIMEEHGLAMAAVVAGGGQGEGRTSENVVGGAFFNYQTELMEAVAESCFCFVEVTGKLRGRHVVRDGFRIIGRVSAVASTQVLFDYLDGTIMRLCREAKPEVPKWFRRGMAERIGERLKQRHAEKLAEQEAAAKAQRDAAAAAGSGNGTALTVTLVDYQQDERDLNEDLRRGLAPGTTRSRRDAAERKDKERNDQMESLQKEGLSYSVA